MNRLADLLADNPILLLCVLLAVGSMIGALSFRRFSLGPAAVLFLALALSAYDERLMQVVLLALALGTNVTVVQRILSTRSKLRGGGSQ